MRKSDEKKVLLKVERPRDGFSCLQHKDVNKQLSGQAEARVVEPRSLC